MSAKPLEGVLVVDLSRYLPGPLAAKMLANLGARVIKIEEPEFGDPVRAAPPLESGASALGRLLLSGVESVALDLTRPEAREVLEAVLGRADVLLESFRPGKLVEFGLGPEDLAERYPRLTICSISGWGGSGPERRRPGHDLTYQAAAGALAATEGMPNLPSADLVGAFAAVAAINGALLARHTTGRGSVIDASLFDAAAVANLTNVAARTAHDREPAPLTGAYPCYRIYDTSDGRRFALAALEPRFWKRFCAATERPELAGLQYKRDAASHRAVAAVFGARTGLDWQELCAEADVPGDLVTTASEASRSPQMAARDLELEAGRLPFPALFDGLRPGASETYPRLGEHTARVMTEFEPANAGMSRRALRAAGIGRRVTLRQAVRRWALGRTGR